MAPRRPRGLKQQQESEVEAQQEQEQEQEQEQVKRARVHQGEDGDDDTAEIMLPTLDEDGQELNEVEEAHTMVTAAQSLVDEGDVEQAQMLLQGAVHEYDRMIRLAAEEGAAADNSATTFDSEFHRFYGDALRELGRLLKDKAHVRAALLRYDTALEQESTNASAIASIATSHLLLASLEESPEAMLAAVREAITGLTSSNVVTAVADNAARADLFATFGHQLLDFADDHEESSKAVFVDVDALFRKALEVDPENHLATAGLGLTFVSICYSLPEDTNADETVTLVDKAIEKLKDAVSKAEKDHSPDQQSRYMIWLAEALVIKMDLVLDDVEANEKHIEEVYRKAAELDESNASYLDAFLNRGDGDDDDDDNDE